MVDFGWLGFGLKDVIDIVMFSITLYYLYQLFRTGTNKALLTGLVTFFLLWLLGYRVFHMRIMGTLLNKVSSVGIIVLVVIFQDDIRKFLVTLGDARQIRFLKHFFRDRSKENTAPNWVAPIILASMNMSRKKTGALIVIERNIQLEMYEHTGERFNADVNARLIENIFFKNSPLHDGAMIIAGNKIRAAGCILPVAGNLDLNKDLGLRHRAALGMSQKTDAKVIIISEERGAISLAYQGEIEVDVDVDRLQRFLIS